MEKIAALSRAICEGSSTWCLNFIREQYTVSYAGQELRSLENEI